MKNHSRKTIIAFFSFFLFIISFPLLNSSINAQEPMPVYVKDYTIGGIAYHTVNDRQVPNPNVLVMVVAQAAVANYSTGERRILVTNTKVVMTDSNGRYSGVKIPCYRDTSGYWNPGFEINITTVGAVGGTTTPSGGWNCTEPDNGFENIYGPLGDTNFGDVQNFGPDSCPIRAPRSVDKPVNTTNGNMWLAQTDYNLPGAGESINVSRLYNSMIQEDGIFGRGWKTDYDSVLYKYTNNGLEYLVLRTGTGRGYFFYKNGNIYQSASAGSYGQFVKNSDGTYTLTFPDGRVHQYSTVGRPLWRKDRNGRQLTYNYNSGNQVTSVTDAFGRTLNFTLNPNGTVAQINDALGVVANYTYNPDNTLQSVIYPDGSKYQYEYVAVAGKIYLATVKDALNNILETHQYDSDGRALTSEMHGGVEKYTFDYTHINDTANAPYTVVTDALGGNTKYTFDKTKGENVVTQIEGNCSCGSGSQLKTYIYDSDINLTKEVDALAREVNYTYDGKGNVITMTNALGTESYTYNQFSQILTKTDRMGGVWTNTYDANGNLLTATDPLNHPTTLTYTAQKEVATVKDALNRVTAFGYDVQGRLAQVTNAQSKTTGYSYDSRSRLTSVTNPLNQTTAYEYDLANRLAKVIHPDLKFQTFAYDLAGRRIAATDERGNTTAYGYDNAHRLVMTTSALNQTTQIGYDLMSNVIATADALGNVTNYEYDNYDRLTKTVYPAEAASAPRLFETYEYDAVGNLKKRTDTAGRQTLYNYDQLNRLTNATDANNKTTHYEYNARSQQTKVTDALAQQYVFGYDPLGRMTSETRAGATAAYQYDAVGNLVSRTDRKGVQTVYAYDNLNRLQTVQYPNPAENAGYTYDDLSRLQAATNYAGTVSFAYDNRSRLIATTDVHGKTVSYTYDDAGNRTQVKLGGVVHTTYAYDQANRLAQMTDDANGVYGFAYDAANRMTTKTLPNNVVTTYDYDGMSRLRRLKDALGTNVIFDKQYSYNQANQIAQIAEPTQTKQFAYDNLDRLTQAVNPATPTTPLESYTYDAVGNRTGSHLSNGYTYQPFNRLSQTQQAAYVYDANGNRAQKSDASGTTQYNWDYENRLRQVTKPNAPSVTYEYDALGRRTKHDVGAYLTKFSYDGEDVILDDVNGDFVKYQNGVGLDNKLKGTTVQGDSYGLTDHLGSVLGLTIQDGSTYATASYDSFGNATSTTLGTRYRYTQRERDEVTELYYYRARWYDPQIGRFISEDPIGFQGGDINLFAYVGNNPQNFTDPSGKNPYEYLKALGSFYNFAEPTLCQDFAPDFVQGGVSFLGFGVSVTLTRDGDVLIGKEADIFGYVSLLSKDPSKIFTKANKFGLSGGVSVQKILKRGRLTPEERMDIVGGESIQASYANGLGLAGQLSPTSKGNYYSVGAAVGAGFSLGAGRSESYPSLKLPISWGAPPPKQQGECDCEK